MTTSLFGVTDDSRPSVLIFGRSSGDGAPERSNLLHSEIENCPKVDENSRLSEADFGFHQNRMHPQSIFGILTSNFLVLTSDERESLYELLLCGWIQNWTWLISFVSAGFRSGARPNQ
jgi:hypothetical protein